MNTTTKGMRKACGFCSGEGCGMCNGTGYRDGQCECSDADRHPPATPCVPSRRSPTERFVDALSHFVASERDFFVADARWQAEQGDGAHLSSIRDAHAASLAQARDDLEDAFRIAVRSQALLEITQSMPYDD